MWELRGEQVVIPIPGKRKQFFETFRGSARAADQRLRDLIDQQAPSRSDGVGVTFGQLLDLWLEECDRMDHSPTTLRTYRSQIEKTIRPALGKLNVARLTASISTICTGP